MLRRFELSAPGARAVDTVVITIFSQCDGYATHFYIFGDAASESDIENFEFEENGPHGSLAIF